MDGQSDDSIAKKAWEIYKQRNDSIIVDLFQGAFKSRVECIECETSSITFDPYMFISVPIPEKRVITVQVNAISYICGKQTIGESEGRQPILLNIVIKRNALIKDLKVAIARKMGWEKNLNCILVREIKANQIEKIYDDYDHVTEISKYDDVYVYEVNSGDSYIHVPVYFSTKKSEEKKSLYYQAAGHDLFGFPLYISIPKEYTFSYRESSNPDRVEMEKKAKFGEEMLGYIFPSLMRFPRSMEAYQKFPVDIDLKDVFNVHFAHGNEAEEKGYSRYSYNFWNDGWKKNLQQLTKEATPIAEGEVTDETVMEESIYNDDKIHIGGNIVLLLEGREEVLKFLFGDEYASYKSDIFKVIRTFIILFNSKSLFHVQRLTQRVLSMRI